MVSLGGSNKSRRPKFLLHLKINELINIPQSQGTCYVKWALKDGMTLGAMSEDNKDEYVGTRGSTNKTEVTKHKARWNYDVGKPVAVKMAVDKTGQLAARQLKMEVYLDMNAPSETLMQPLHAVKKATSSTISSAGSTITAVTNTNTKSKPSDITKITLGSVTINLADYVSEQEPEINGRYLLQNAKVNSILDISVRMKMTRGSYTDFKKNTTTKTSSLRSSNIADILADRNSEFSNGASNSNHNGTSQTVSISTASVSPTAYMYYQKITQLPWDPRPGEYTPAETAQDCLNGGDGWAKTENGDNLVDLYQ